MNNSLNLTKKTVKPAVSPKTLRFKNFSISQLILISLSALIFSVLILIYFDRISSFEHTQKAIAGASGSEVANQISFILKERQRHVQLFLEDNRSLIQEFLVDTENDSKFEDIQHSLRRTFPDYFAFTITDNQGVPLFVDFEGYVGDMCVMDIKTYSKTKNYTARIHPNSYKFHYDVIAVSSNEEDKPYFLMVTFEPDELANILKVAQYPGHELMLITDNQPQLMEVTAKGGRDKTPRDDYRLTADELGKILASHPIQHSSWIIADFQQPDFFAEYRKSTMVYFGSFLLLFGLVIATSFKLLRKEEHLRHSAELGREKLLTEVSKAALYDSLTKLPNRYLFDDQLKQAIAVSKRTKCYGTILFLDLDNFKPVNDTYGHVVGDLLLVEAAKRLISSVRDTDTVSRFGGDEFVVLLNNTNIYDATSKPQVEIIAQRIRSSLSEIYVLTVENEAKEDTTVKHHCTVSIGAASFNGDDSYNDILKRADAAMYKSKHQGRNQIWFDNAEV
ncbi:MAG: GGDEF domain-containing protein [Gammaproteobacteria bacterium]|nr:GGDEF domain-containing protein [Gammaproteobacteria bacterium]